MYFYQPFVDIKSYPKRRFYLKQEGAISLGDLHANPIKLLHFLVKFGYVKIGEQSYQNIVQSYQNIVDEYEDLPNSIYLDKALTTIKKIKKIKKIKNIKDEVGRITRGPNQKALRLIGDELCDRGKNDEVMIALLERLTLIKCQWSVMASNHGFEFMRYAFSNASEEKPLPNIFSNGADWSLKAFHKSCPNPIEKARAFCEKTYFPNLRLIDYAFQNGKHVIYAHAPISIAMILGVAEVLGVNLDKFVEPGTPIFENDKLKNGKLNLSARVEDLSRLKYLVDQVNDAFLTKVKLGDIYAKVSIKNASKGRLDSIRRQCITRKRKKDSGEAQPFSINRDSILQAIFWNGDFSIYDDGNNIPKGVRFVHGHTPTPEDLPTKVRRNVYNLDNTLGKGYYDNKGKMLTDCSARQLTCLSSKRYWDYFTDSHWGVSLLTGVGVGLGVGFGTSFAFFAAASTALFYVGQLAVTAGLLSSFLLGVTVAVVVAAVLYGAQCYRGYDFSGGEAEMVYSSSYDPGNDDSLKQNTVQVDHNCFQNTLDETSFHYAR